MKAERIASLTAGLLLVGAVGHSALAQHDNLLEMIPPDAGVVVVCDDLRDQTREILGSPIIQRIQRQTWFRPLMQSSNLQSLRAVRREIEATTNVRLASVWEEILGDSVVLAMIADPGPEAGDVRGLFLARVRDRKTLDDVIAKVNAAETQAGILQSVDPVEAKDKGSYWHRRFRPGTKPDEWYTIVGDRVFAWSNSEAQVQAVIRRHAEGPQADFANSRYQTLANALPGRSLAKIFVDPRFVDRIWSGPVADHDPFSHLLNKHLDQTLDLAAALQWKDGLILHLHERFAPSLPGEVPPKDRPSSPSPRDVLNDLPESALLVVSAQVDFKWLIETFREILPAADQARLDAALNALGGMCLGKSVVRDIAPALGPQTLAFLVPSSNLDRLFDLVAAVQMDPAATLQAALQNGVRTLFSLAVLDLSAQLRERNLDEKSSASMLTLKQEARSWSVVVRPDRFLVASSSLILAKRMANDAPASKSQAIMNRKAYVPDASTFAILDCQALAKLARSRRDRLVKRWATDTGRPEVDVVNDLDKAVLLVSLFRVAFASDTRSADRSSAHQTLGLIFATDAAP